MKIIPDNPIHRLLVYLAAIICLIGLLAVDRFLYLPAGSGIITIVLWLLLLGIGGALLYEILPIKRKPSPLFSYYSGPVSSQIGSGNPWVQKANRVLILWCLSAAYEILVLMVLPALFPYFTDSGSIDLPGVVGILIIIGIPVFFLVMFWSENTYVDTVRWLDPDLASGWQIPSSWSGLPFFIPALLIAVYSVFLGWFFADRVMPVLLPFLPASVSLLLNPLLFGATLALIATPALIYLIYKRRE